MKLAKDIVDFGLYTNEREAMLAFWQQEVGLPFEETLPAGGGVHQHRHDLCGAVFKLNHSRDALPKVGPSGYRELWIAREGVGDDRVLVDPDGNRVRLVASGRDGIEAYAVVLGVRDPEAHRIFYEDVLGLEHCGPGVVRWGRALIRFERDPSLPEDVATANNAVMRAPGYRYLTVQVFDVDDEHARIVSAGALEGYPPRTLGRVARISFVRDPDGNWIEISQRASLTGALPGS